MKREVKVEEGDKDIEIEGSEDEELEDLLNFNGEKELEDGGCEEVDGE